MAYSIQMSDVQASSIKNIAGFCPPADSFYEVVNEVTRRLMRKGGWWQTEVLMRLCVQGCNIVWPAQVGTVLGVRFCCGGEVPLKNNHWAIWGYKSCNGWRGDAIIRDDGTRPCTNEISGSTGKYLRYHITKIGDVGKTIRFFGFAYGNQPLQELDASGNWVMGLTLTATQTGVQSTVLATKITSIVREATQGRSFLYEVDPTSGDLRDLAFFEPNQTNPSFRCSRINGMNSLGYKEDSYGRRIRQMEALVKLAFVPVRTPDDFVLLDSIDALKQGIAAFKLEEAGDDDAAEVKWIKAVRELNAELRDMEPGLQTVISVNSISSNATICNPI